MSVVFHEGAVKDCEPPCVAQTFVPHDALLFKIFVIGSKHFVVERPSLKNFEAAGKRDSKCSYLAIDWFLWFLTGFFNRLELIERETIFFDSHDVSKPDSVSSLSILDDDDVCDTRPTMKQESLDKLVAMLRQALGMSLFGVDIVVEKSSGLYAIIDINAFPGINATPFFFKIARVIFYQLYWLLVFFYFEFDQVTRECLTFLCTLPKCWRKQCAKKLPNRRLLLSLLLLLLLRRP